MVVIKVSEEKTRATKIPRRLINTILFSKFLQNIFNIICNIQVVSATASLKISFGVL